MAEGEEEVAVVDAVEVVVEIRPLILTIGKPNLLNAVKRPSSHRIQKDSNIGVARKVAALGATIPRTLDRMQTTNKPMLLKTRTPRMPTTKTLTPMTTKPHRTKEWLQVHPSLQDLPKEQSSEDSPAYDEQANGLQRTLCTVS